MRRFVFEFMCIWTSVEVFSGFMPPMNMSVTLGAAVMGRVFVVLGAAVMGRVLGAAVVGGVGVA